MSKVEKQFVITDNSVNIYGFRLLTEGYMLEEFEKNPIGYYMHNRDLGVLVKWEDLQKKGDTVVGYPNINLSHVRGTQTIEEINGGFLNAASVGHIIVIEAVDDPKLKLPGQTGPTITKWYNRECSLVDIPGNENALCLYNLKGEEINLNLFAKSANIKSLSSSSPIDDNAVGNINIDEQLKNAVNNKDITQEQVNELRKQYVNSPDKLTNLLHKFGQMRIKYLMSLDWNDLDKKGLLPELKEKFLQGYQQKFYTEFGKDDKTVEEQKKTNDTGIDAEIERLKEFAINNGDLEPEVAKKMQDNFKDNPEKLKKLFQEAPQNRIHSLMEFDWDKLDKEGLLPELKQKYLQGFKQKYKVNFGIDYKENK